jgi:hypothetical protein
MHTTILIIFIAVIAFCAIAPAWCKSNPTKENFYGLEAEIDTIFVAARRNGCNEKLFNILLAIRKAEGTPTFGIKHPACRDMVRKDPNNAADIYAAFAAATVVKSYHRFQKADNRLQTMESFINFLGDRYCPHSVDPDGNHNWKQNVKYWFKKFEEAV